MLIASQDAFGSPDPLYPDRLSMAVNRQNTSVGSIYKYNTTAEVGASLFFGIANSHAFENGNKRTALVTLLVFLDRNRTVLVGTTEDDLYELATQLVKHELPILPHRSRSADTEVVAVADWIEARCRPLTLGDRFLLFFELEEILTQLGCEFERPDRNFVKIRRGKWMVKTGYPRANFDIAVNEIKRIRRALRLDEAHGTDSVGFYNLDGQVDRFVNHYRNLMRRLADS
jgi:death-on-curing protein